MPEGCCGYPKKFRKIFPETKDLDITVVSVRDLNPEIGVG